MPKPLPTRKGIRLAPPIYEGPAVFTVTISTAQRQKAFTDEGAVSLCLFALKETATRQRIEVLAYCFMPDHLHLLVEAKDGGNLIRFMKAFKQRAGYRYRQTFRQQLWQKGYYDHILRKDEDIRLAAEYIFQNPMRARLVNSPYEYPFLGGTLFETLRAT